MLQVIANGTKPAYLSITPLVRTVQLQFTGPGLHDLRLSLYEVLPAEARHMAAQLLEAADRADALGGDDAA